MAEFDAHDPFIVDSPSAIFLRNIFLSRFLDAKLTPRGTVAAQGISVAQSNSGADGAENAGSKTDGAESLDDEESVPSSSKTPGLSTSLWSTSASSAFVSINWDRKSIYGRETWKESSNVSSDSSPSSSLSPSPSLLSSLSLRAFIAGAVAGVVSRTATAPLDRVKVILQAETGASATATLASLRGVLAREGVFALWRGNGVNVLKIAPETAIKFAAFEEAKAALRRRRGGAQTLGVGERFLAGASAGAIAQTCIYPLEILKTRLIVSTSSDFSGIVSCARHCFRSGGVRCFFRGYVPNILGIIPYAGIDLTVYEFLKEELSDRFRDPSTISPEASDRDSTPISGSKPPPCVACLLVCGVVSSSCGQIASYPLALVRVRMQAGSDGARATMTSIARGIWEASGLRGFYRGLGPNLLKVAPAFAISYAVYENVKARLGGVSERSK